MPFPMIKLFSLVVKHISKPVASYIKKQSKEYRFVGKYLCMPPAQLYHRWDVNLRLMVAGTRRSSSFKVAPLSEEQAIQQGSDLLGEAFVFSVAAGLVLFEYRRQAAKTAAHEEEQELSLVRLSKDVKKLRERIAEQGEDLHHAVRMIEVASNMKIENRDKLFHLTPPIVHTKPLKR